MSASVSRAMDRRAFAPPPTRSSMIESERPGALVEAPGSAVDAPRRSDPRTRMVCGLVRGKPAPPSCASAASETLPCSICALTRNRTAESRTQPTSASTTHRTTRHGPGAVNRRRPRCGGSSRGPSGATSTASPPRPKSLGRERYFVYSGGASVPFGALMQRCMVAGVMSGACVIGVDLGGTKLLAGVVDADLRVHHRTQRLVPHADTAALLDSVSQAVEEARGAARDPVVGVGFGIACLMDDRRGVAATSVHLPISDLPFADVMRERTGLPVQVDNDA